jgi:hypothetical protein
MRVLRPRFVLRGLLLSAALLCATLTGCPPPAGPTPGGGPTGPNRPVPTDGTAPAPTGTDGAAPPATDAAPAGGDAAPWAVIAPEKLEKVYPMLVEAKSWPAPAALKAPKDVAEAQRPKPERVAMLLDLVKKVVKADLLPRDLEAAVGVDERGRTFVRLGKDKAVGSASLDVRAVPTDKRFDFPILAITLEDAKKGPQTLQLLNQRVQEVLVEGIGREMNTDEGGKRPYALEASPQAADADGFAALAALDPAGFGTQFRYLYAWGTDKHLLLVLQEVPHMNLNEPR